MLNSILIAWLKFSSLNGKFIFFRSLELEIFPSKDSIAPSMDENNFRKNRKKNFQPWNRLPLCPTFPIQFLVVTTPTLNSACEELFSYARCFRAHILVWESMKNYLHDVTTKQGDRGSCEEKRRERKIAKAINWTLGKFPLVFFLPSIDGFHFLCSLADESCLTHFVHFTARYFHASRDTDIDPSLWGISEEGFSSSAVSQRKFPSLWAMDSKWDESAENNHGDSISQSTNLFWTCAWQ